ncbi:MAG: AraC family transcriptional regulator [Verrucomicrobia bacterium]|nr:AraC family transcriptional regulator [Verrucomicrobiota bacterium]
MGPAVKPVFEKTPRRQWESFHCEVVRGASYDATWHFHPELQLTLVLKSSGYRLVGDKITPLEPGDLVLVGANLPHVWQQDGSRNRSQRAVHAIVVRFLDTFLGRDIFETPEIEPVRKLFKRASRGLEIIGRTRDAVAARIEELPQLRGLARISELLAILDLLAQSRELKPIASTGFVPSLSSEDQGRMQRVTDYIQAHLADAIDRDAVAREAHLSAGAFSRFFKLRTGKTLPEYVNELRVGRACRLLVEEELKVTDVALECGFRNLANFNRRFRAITKLPPREYRRQFRQNAA